MRAKLRGGAHLGDVLHRWRVLDRWRDVREHRGRPPAHRRVHIVVLDAKTHGGFGSFHVSPKVVNSLPGSTALIASCRRSSLVRE